MVQVKVGIFELEAPYIAGAVGMRPKKPERLFITTGRVTTDKVTLMALCLECFLSLNDTKKKKDQALLVRSNHRNSGCITLRYVSGFAVFSFVQIRFQNMEAIHMSRHASEAVLHSQFPHMATDKESYSTYQ